MQYNQKNALEMKDKNMCKSKRQKSIKNLVVKTKKRGRKISSKGVWGLMNTCCTNVSNEIHLPLANYMFVGLSEVITSYFFMHTSENS